MMNLKEKIQHVRYKLEEFEMWRKRKNKTLEKEINNLDSVSILDLLLDHLHLHLSTLQMSSTECEMVLRFDID